MLAADIPELIALPFANSGTRDTIPTASQIGITDGKASLTDGFPPLTMTPLDSGGVPPTGGDMNGILYRITAVQRWQNAGGIFKYNSAFSTSIGGYPKGAILLSADGVTEWLCTADNTTTNPDSSSTGWVPLAAYGLGVVTGLTNVNVTLTPTQYSKDVIVLTGALSGNIQIIFPVFKRRWLVVNNTTGAYTITCRTATGTGGTVASATQEEFYGDGVNLVLRTYSALSSFAGAIMYFPTSSAPAGFLKANGATVSVLTYAALFAVIGTTFGGDGIATFVLPDMRGEFPRGLDDSRGVDPGRALGSAQGGAIEAHTHTVREGSFSPVPGGQLTSGDDYTTATAFYQTSGSTGGTETRPRNIALLACIKT